MFEQETPEQKKVYKQFKRLVIYVYEFVICALILYFLTL